MTNEELSTSDATLIARLRELSSFENGVGVMQDFYCGEEMLAAADRIEALIAERDQWIAHAKNAIWADSEELQAAEAKLAENEVRLRKAVEALENVHRFGVITHPARATLAEIKSCIATTPYGLEGESHE